MKPSPDFTTLSASNAISDARQQAWQPLANNALPNPDDEAWRKTRLTPLAAALGEQWWLPSESRATETTYHIANAVRISSDGSVIDPLPDGITLQPLHEMLQCGNSEIAAILATADDYTARLNSSWVQDGLCLCIADGAQITQPIQIIDQNGSGANYRLHAIHIGSGAQMTLIEQFSNPTLGLTCSSSHIRLQAGAHLTHYRLQQHSTQHFHLGRVELALGRDANYQLHAVELGAAISRLDLISNLNQPGASCDLHGLFLLGGRQHADHHITMNHAAPHCQSRADYRTVLDGRAHAVFNGRVMVAKGAVGTDSAQHNGNILLSRRAQIDSKPELEIYNDDVKCAHGATVGQLDAEQLFYLQSRGLSEDESRELLVTAFAATMLKKIDLPQLRQQVEQAVKEKLPHGDN
ncbi:MAG: Fe-S cluster assembly protein SufD [Mariprofundales bacterium]